MNKKFPIKFEKIYFFAIIFLFILSLDYISKRVMLQFFEKNEFHSLQIIPNFFHLTFAINYGISFGIFNNPKTQQFLFVLLNSFIVLSINIYAIYSLVRRFKCHLSECTLSDPLKSKGTGNASSYSMLFGLALLNAGAIGNIFDRMQYGYVIDFLHVFYKTLHFPIFNIADSAIFLGMCFLYCAFLKKKD